ncbi:MAG: cohesin domain-containing protein [Lachnospiraceae bacterium]
MKVMKKISAVLLTLCLVLPCFSMVASAADGKISFSDPQTKVGDMVEVKCAVRTTGATLGNVEVKIAYDSSALSFQSGDGVEKDGDGALTCSASGNSSEQIFMIKFQALEEGTTQITISDSTVASDSGAELTFDYGNSTVTIGAGDPSKIKKSDDETEATSEDMEVEVNGETYTLTDNFSDGDIPNGYQRTQVELEGQQRQMVANENSGITLAYLIGNNIGDFFVYNTDDATFSPYEELSISDTTSIVLMSDTSQVNLPESYIEAEYTIDEKTFPVWQDTSDEECYILYAVNSNNGESGYYKYDTLENTYQRFNPEMEADDEEEPGGLLGKVQRFIQDNIQKIVLFGGLGAILILLIIIILGIKLHNRNVELDELYEEYGIDEEEEVPEKTKDKKSSKFGFGKKKDEFDDEDFDEDDFDDEFATENMEFTEDMGIIEDEFATENMSLDEDEFPTEDMGYIEEDEFPTDDMGYIGEDEFPTDDIGYIGEDDFATAQLDYDEGDLLDDVDTDEFVVYGGESRTEELTIDDLDELLGDKQKKDEKKDMDETFKMDFIDLD